MSMPEDLSGSRELSTSNTSLSDMSIETNCCLTEVSTLVLFVAIKLLVEQVDIIISKKNQALKI